MDFLTNMLEGLYESEAKPSTIPTIALSTLDFVQIHAAINASAAFLEGGLSTKADENYYHQQFIDSSLVVMKYLKYFDPEKVRSSF
jgi:hypothetical protein